MGLFRHLSLGSLTLPHGHDVDLWKFTSVSSVYTVHNNTIDDGVR